MAIRKKQTRKPLTGVAIINDEEHEVKQEYLEVLENKGALYILSSNRNEAALIAKLAA